MGGVPRSPAVPVFEARGQNCDGYSGSPTDDRATCPPARARLNDRHRGSSYLLSPATPPDKRVRIRRFEESRSTEPGNTELIAPAKTEDSVQRCAAVAPQAAHIACHHQRNIRPCTSCPKFSIRGRATPPLLQLDDPHPVAYPLIQLAPDLWSFRFPQVSLPT